MSKLIINYAPVSTGETKRNHLLFLDKNGYKVHYADNAESLVKCANNDPLTIIVHDAEHIRECSEVLPTVPIIVLSKNTHFSFKLQEKYQDLTNIIFFRSEFDPIDTILETVKFIEKIEHEQ